MLYLARCRGCAFQVYSCQAKSIKVNMAMHMEKSHGYDFEFVAGTIRTPDFEKEGKMVSRVMMPIRDFEELFIIDRFHDAHTINLILFALAHKGYWKAQRY